MSIVVPNAERRVQRPCRRSASLSHVSRDSDLTTEISGPRALPGGSEVGAAAARRDRSFSDVVEDNHSCRRRDDPAHDTDFLRKRHRLAGSLSAHDRGQPGRSTECRPQHASFRYMLERY